MVSTGSSLHAQCTNGTQPECRCSTAPVLCTIDELDGYSFSMAAYQHPNDGPSPICPGAFMTQSNNPTWFAFTAWCTNLTLRVSSSNCTQSQGNVGFQLAIYTDCSFDDVVACNADIDDCNTNDKVLNLSGLNIGSIYYFMVDGCLGSYCTVTIDVLGICGQEIIVPWSEPITGNIHPCVANAELYEIEDLDGARNYHWLIDGVEVAQTTTNSFEYVWTTRGTFQLCVDASNDPCVSVEDQPMPLCTTITVHDANPGTLMLAPHVLCAGDTIFANSSGFITDLGNRQFLTFSDHSGVILDTIIGASGKFTSTIPGEFHICAYNIANGEPGPTPGQSLLDFSAECFEGHCEIIYFNQLQTEIINIICNNNGTGNDTTDDSFTFELLTIGVTSGMQWMSTDGTLQGSYGSIETFGPYLIANGNLSFDLHDVNYPSCQTSVFVEAPVACSSCNQSLDAGPDNLINCINTEAILTGTASETGLYLWTGPDSFMSDSLVCVVSIPGWYYLNVDFGNQCIIADSAFVAGEIDSPIANAGADQQLDCNTQEIILATTLTNPDIEELQWLNTSGQIVSTQSQFVTDTAGPFILQVSNTQSGCNAFDTVQVTINQIELGVISIQIQDETCQGLQDGTIEVVNISSGSPPFLFSLNGTVTNNTGLFDQLSPGEHLLQITDAEGCDADTVIVINMGIDFQINLPDTIFIEEGHHVPIQPYINVPITTIHSLQWHPGNIVSCDTCLNTTINTNENHTLIVTAVYENGCNAEDETVIIIFPALAMYIPNIFSPNNDGFNDLFTLYSNGSAISIIELNIFSRWGEHLFHGTNFPLNNAYVGWDGKFHDQEMLPGVFTYTAQVLLANGAEKVMKGQVTLVR